jgi:hypothetical protein
MTLPIPFLRLGSHVRALFRVGCSSITIASGSPCCACAINTVKGLLGRLRSRQRQTRRRVGEHRWMSRQDPRRAAHLRDENSFKDAQCTAAAFCVHVHSA